MLRPIPGVLYAGRFYADERPGGRPGVFPSVCPAKELRIQENWAQEEADRQYIYKCRRVSRDQPYGSCSSCNFAFQQPHIHEASPKQQENAYSCCCHCHKVIHLCRCKCCCCKCRNKVCFCPLCTCTCGHCIKCQRKEATRYKQYLQHEQLTRQLMEKFEDEEIKRQQARDFKSGLHKMYQEKLRLQQALIDCYTYEERAQLKHKLFLNYKLIGDCKELLEDNVVDSHASEADVYRLPQFGKTSGNHEADLLVAADVSPSSSQSLPEPQPELSYKNDRYPPQERLFKRIFGKYARESFESGQDVVKTLFPVYFSDYAGFAYYGEVVEPEILLNGRVYRFSEFPEVYEQINKLFVRACLSQFERNVAYAIILHTAFRKPAEVLFKVCNLGSKVTYLLPFPAAHQPPFALVQLDGKAVANVGVPFYCGRAMLPRYIRSQKRGRFEIETEFKCDLLLKTAEKAIQIVSSCLQRYVK